MSSQLGGFEDATFFDIGWLGAGVLVVFVVVVVAATAAAAATTTQRVRVTTAANDVRRTLLEIIAKERMRRRSLNARAVGWEKGERTEERGDERDNDDRRRKREGE